MWEELSTESPNEEVVLYEGHIAFRQGQIAREGVGKVFIQWAPHPWIVALMTYEARTQAEIDGVQFAASTITLPDFPNEPTLKGQGSPHGVKYSFSDGPHQATLRIGINGSEIVDDGAPLLSATGYIANFPFFIFQSRTGETGRLRLRNSQWDVEINPVPKCYDLDRALAREGGYALTHRFVLKRRDKDSFSGRELREFLNVLRNFLSLARGAWSAPVATVGRDSGGNPCWTHWGVWNLSRGAPHFSWWDELHPESLEDLFPKFVNAFEVLSDELSRAVHWYVIANTTSSPETALIIAQVALELLSWTLHYNRDAQAWTAEGHSSRRLNRHLEAAGVPTGIPATYSHLFRYALDKNPREPEMRIGPIVLTDVRNETVHPDRPGSMQRRDSELGYEARELGLWYLELALLSACGYSGVHVSRPMKRQVVGQVEPVPWANNALGWPYD